MDELFKKARSAFEGLNLIKSDPRVTYQPIVNNEPSATLNKASEAFRRSPANTILQDAQKKPLIDKERAKKTSEATTNFLKEILQSTARSFDFVGRKTLDTIFKPIEKKTGIDFTSQLKNLDEKDSNTIENFLYGGNEKRKDSLAEVGESEFGVDREKNPVLAPVLGFAGVALDVWPGFGKGVKIGTKELSLLSKLNKADEVIDVLKASGVKASEAKKIASDIAKTTDTAEIQQILKNGGTPPKTTKKGTQASTASEKTVKKATDVVDDYVYHTTSPKNLESIKKQGLKPTEGQYGRGVYFAPTEVKTGGYGSSEGVMTRVNRKNLPDDFQEWPGEQGWTNNTIPPEAIEYKKPGESWKPLVPESESYRSVGEILENKKIGNSTVSRETVIKPKKNERRFITRTRALEPNLDEYLKGTKETRSTEDLITRADELIAKNPAQAENIAKTGTDDFSVAVASRLIDSRVKSAKEAVSEVDKLKAWEDVADIANEAARNLTENGRAIQAATILGKMTPEGMVRFAARTIQKHNDAIDSLKNPVNRTLGDIFGTKQGKALKKIPEITPQQVKEITEEMERIGKIADDTERAMAFQKLDDKIKSMVPSSLYKKLITVWKAGLLTGIKTTGLNISSNVSHSATEMIKDVPASLVDRVMSMFTGKRTLGLTTKGSIDGAREGVAKGWRYFKTGFDERDIGSKLEFNKVNFGDSKFAKAIQAYEETIFRSLGSEDQPFYYGAKARSLYSQAIAQAKNAGKKGTEAKAFIDELVKKPTDEMLKYATLDAETAVFQNKTTLGKLAKSVQSAPGGEVVLPFGKTPSSVAMQIANYTPVGIVRALVKYTGKGKFDQRLFSQAVGRGLTGTGAMYLGMQMLKDDMITTEYPTSEKERELWELEGRQSNSIKIGGKWRNPGVLGPLGLVMIIGAHFQEGIDETGSFVGGLSKASGGFGSTLTDQSFLRGINSTIEAINDPTRSFNGWASSLAGSIVPTIISDIARSTDQYERRTSNPGERIQSRIPGLRQGLEPKVDAFGEKVETPSFFTTLLDASRPTQPTADPNDPVFKEYQRLRDEGYLATPTQLGPSKGYASLTDEQNTYLWQIAGKVARDEVERLMQRKSWNRLDDEQKTDAIEEVITDVKNEARARVAIKALEGLTQQEKEQKLTEMADDKLLTKTVYGLYRSLTR